MTTPLKRPILSRSPIPLGATRFAILIAEDDPVSRRLLEATLARWDYEVVVTCDGPSALEHLRRDDAPSLALLDLIMPGMNGDRGVPPTSRRFDAKYAYLLLLTSKSHKADLIHGLNAGADDYLVKPVDPMELKARLNTGRRILGLQEQLITAREVMRRQAMRDSLTGAWNHAAILDILKRELHRAARGRGSQRRSRRPGSFQERQRHLRSFGRRRGVARSLPPHGQRDASV